jgi:hypothetical protein
VFVIDVLERRLRRELRNQSSPAIGTFGNPFRILRSTFRAEHLRFPPDS